MSQAPVDPFALVNLSMTQDEMQHRRRQQMLDDQYRERVFARKQLSEDRARNDKFYANTLGRMDAAFWDNMSKSMSEMTFGAMMADVRAQRAAGTPPLFLFDDKDIMPNPNANQLIEGAGPGAKGTMPGLIPKSAADRAKEGEAEPDAATTDEPVAESITPEKPEPDGATATPQQQAVQDVRNRAAQGQQRAAGPRPNPGMQSPRNNINSMHVDPVTGQWFANVQGQFLPVDREAMSMIQDWQKLSIASYAAETKRMNSETARKGLATQTSLLGDLIAKSNHNSLMAFLDQFPNTPDDLLAMLTEGASTITGKGELYDRHLGEIASAMQAGDQAGLDAAVFALSEHIYDVKQETWRKDLEYHQNQIDMLEEELAQDIYEYAEVGTEAHGLMLGFKKDLNEHRAQERILRNNILAQARPRRSQTKRPPTSENIGAVVDNTINNMTSGRNYDAMIKEQRNFEAAIKSGDWESMVEEIVKRLQAAGHDTSQIDPVDVLVSVAQALGMKGFEITTEIQPSPQNMSNETAAPSQPPSRGGGGSETGTWELLPTPPIGISGSSEPVTYDLSTGEIVHPAQPGGGESEAKNQVRQMYEDWLRRNNLPPGPQTYEEFQRILTGGPINPAGLY